jgi:hypothetical protein
MAMKEEPLVGSLRILLSLIPVLATIQSLLVSTIVSKSELVSLSSGTNAPTAVIDGFVGLGLI